MISGSGCAADGVVLAEDSVSSTGASVIVAGTGRATAGVEPPHASSATAVRCNTRRTPYCRTAFTASPLCERRMRQLPLDMCVAIGGEWVLDDAEAVSMFPVQIGRAHV